MSRALLVLSLLVAVTAPARADDPTPTPQPEPDQGSPPAPPAPDQGSPPAPSPGAEHLARGRSLYEQGQYAEARAELRLAYDADPQPGLLFALGQVELQLENYRAAIDYYERFLATGPDEHDAALAQQAIGAARNPPPPKTRTRRRWDGIDWALTAVGVVAAGTGAGLIAYGHHLSTDRSGSIADYDHRLDRAERIQWIGLGVSVAGVAAIATAFIRYGIHRERVQIGVTATGDQIGVSLSGPL